MKAQGSVIKDFTLTDIQYMDELKQPEFLNFLTLTFFLHKMLTINITLSTLICLCVFHTIAT